MSGIFDPHELEFLASTLPSQPCARIDAVELLTEARVLNNGEEWYSRLNCRATRADALREMMNASIVAHAEQLDQQRTRTEAEARASANEAVQRAAQRADAARRRYAEWLMETATGRQA